MTDNEKEALGILRMLNAGNTRAFDESLKLVGGEKLAALELINKMILCDKEGGRALLAKYTSDKQLINKILGLVYEPKHPAYLLVDGSLLGMLDVFCTLANWDFKKYDLWQNMAAADKDKFVNYAVKKFGYSRSYSESLYQNMWLSDREKPLDWIAKDRYRFYSYGLTQKSADKDAKVILFNSGLLADKDNANFYYWQDALKRWIVPGEIIYITKGKVEERTVKGNKGYSLLFSDKGNTYEEILMDRKLAHSMLIKLYFMRERTMIRIRTYIYIRLIGNK